MQGRSTGSEPQIDINLSVHGNRIGNGFSPMSGNLAAEVNYLPRENQAEDRKQPDDIDALDGIR